MFDLHGTDDAAAARLFGFERTVSAVERCGATAREAQCYYPLTFIQKADGRGTEAFRWC